jgi:hypothetical protein
VGAYTACEKEDPSLKTFIFTLKNPHDVPARKFSLQAGRRRRAIICESKRGPSFWDIVLAGDSNANRCSNVYAFGLTYNNDTGLPGDTFLTGEKYFTTKEIEVFEITD